jgi:L-asparaginase
MAHAHKILLITTGGTIAGQVAGDQQDETMVRSADEFTRLLSPTIGYLNRKHDIDIEICTQPLCDLDSSNMRPEHWTSLAALIREQYDQYDSFLITHGTNTLGYTCAALSFALANPNKPIVLTGSQSRQAYPVPIASRTSQTPCDSRYGDARRTRSRVSWQCLALR